ncbi:hypothetical protein KY289_023751 [Solanum tuberosum]|nr:hypothetical protein KY289_023751 [Solanum tuberosum]
MQQSAPWIVDSGASHHVASDAHGLNNVADYNGPEEIAMGNGNTIPISHTVSQFCRDNNTSIEFFPFSYLVKDLSTGAPLVQGRSRGLLYEWPLDNPSSSSQP